MMNDVDRSTESEPFSKGLFTLLNAWKEGEGEVEHKGFKTLLSAGFYVVVK